MKIIIACLIQIFVTIAADEIPVTTLEDYYAKNNGSRIIGGSPAVVGQFPWQVFIQIMRTDGSASCGGSIIDVTTILTAAHCAYGGTSFTLYFGGLSLNGTEEGRIYVHATKAIVHPRYDAQLAQNDVAIIKLDAPLNFTSRINAVRLPARGETIGNGQRVRVSGWGKTSDASNFVSNVLNWVELTTVTNAFCATYYGVVIANSTLCAQGNPYHSTCNGDSGGPLVLIGSNGVATQHGVVSFVADRGCASGYPSGYMRTESLLDWIDLQKDAGHMSGIFISKGLLICILIVKYTCFGW